MARYRITEYGDTVEFASLDEAERVIRDCGPEFAVTLSIPTRDYAPRHGRSGLAGDTIENQDGEPVGIVVE